MPSGQTTGLKSPHVRQPDVRLRKGKCTQNVSRGSTCSAHVHKFTILGRGETVTSCIQATCVTRTSLPHRPLKRHFHANLNDAFDVNDSAVTAVLVDMWFASKHSANQSSVELLHFSRCRAAPCMSS